MGKESFNNKLFFNILDYIIFEKYINGNQGVSLYEKPGYGFLYNEKCNYCFNSKNLLIKKDILNEYQKKMVYNVILFLNKKSILDNYYNFDSEILFIIKWYINNLSLPKFDKSISYDKYKLLEILSGNNGNIIYPEKYDFNKQNIITYLFKESSIKNSFIVNYLYLICFHGSNFQLKDIKDIILSFSNIEKIDKGNPYVYLYYGRFIIRTLGHIYNKHEYNRKGLKYLLFSYNLLDPKKNLYIYFWISSGYLYLKNYDKSIFFAKKGIDYGYDQNLIYLQLSRGFIYSKKDIDTGISILLGLKDYRRYKTLSIGYLYKSDFLQAKKYILKFLNFLIERDGLINIDFNTSGNKFLYKNNGIESIYIFLGKNYYLESNYRLLNGEGIEELCYYCYNEITDFSIIK